MRRGEEIGCVAGGGTFRVLYFIGLFYFCFIESIILKSCLAILTAAQQFLCWHRSGAVFPGIQGGFS